ncbi:MAG: hypothetical protein LQ350_005801 [Teloschistes chrysophthalmus]|nr:MAG: hypothetical protein LQ350_005801 [Niorma chrysophthalma]
MSFYYNYTGPNAGTVRVNEANQTPQTQQPVNPWHSPAPNTQASNPTPQTASTTFVYHPRYGSGSPPAAQPKPAEPVNPWKAPAPEADKASTFHAMSFARQSLQPAPVAPPAYQPFVGPYYVGHPSPEPANVWLGSTKAQVDAQNAALAQNVGAYQPIQLVPAAATTGQQFYCRELDGSYTLRTTTDIETSCQPGIWQTARTGYPYFVRDKSA